MSNLLELSCCAHHINQLDLQLIDTVNLYSLIQILFKLDIA